MDNSPSFLPFQFFGHTGDVGFLADFERAEIPVPLHAPGTVDRQHLDRRLGAKHLGAEKAPSDPPNAVDNDYRECWNQI
jgi:hypothetical protein